LSGPGRATATATATVARGASESASGAAVRVLRSLSLVARRCCESRGGPPRLRARPSTIFVRHAISEIVDHAVYHHMILYS
jgi:hypothetical protein